MIHFDFIVTNIVIYFTKSITLNTTICSLAQPGTGVSNSAPAEFSSNLN